MTSSRYPRTVLPFFVLGDGPERLWTFGTLPLPCIYNYERKRELQRLALRERELERSRERERERESHVTVPFRAFRILVGGTVPFRSVPFRIIVTTHTRAIFRTARDVTRHGCNSLRINLREKSSTLSVFARLWRWPVRLIIQVRLSSYLLSAPELRPKGNYAGGAKFIAVRRCWSCAVSCLRFVSPECPS